MMAGVPKWIWDGKTLPVPIEDIADSHFGLLVRDVDDLGTAPGAPPLGPGQSLSGLLLADKAQIWVSRPEGREWPARRRFTIAHELGHWCMHRAGRERLFCRASAVDPPEERPERPVVEREADAFAAALLMPAQLMQREYKHDREFERLCERFEVSGSAMGRRLHATIPRTR
jgi:hypothetical protein